MGQNDNRFRRGALPESDGTWIRVSRVRHLACERFAAARTLRGDPPEGYLSPEPWMGMQNSLNLGMGLVRLAPGEEATWTIVVEAEAFVR